jgi:2,4-dienoyl-CoA reductase-like NADH-dependent reductase (Old Yellow Enzyme family)
MTLPLLLTPQTLRSVTITNRIWMAPMCQYSADPTGPRRGVPNDWHLQHYASRAVGGAGLILVEATAVSPDGRITPWDLGLWDDTQVDGHRRITRALREQGTVPAVQLAHAGRKAGTDRPWTGGGSLPVGDGSFGWVPVGPSPIGFSDASAVPHELTVAQITEIVEGFAAAARRAVDAGYEVIEVHGAHGYLLHEFCSPGSNRRTDGYGGDLAGRTRLAIEVVDAVRAAVPDGMPIVYRLSATDWVEPQGWTVEQTVELSRLLVGHGVDAVHVSSGGNTPEQRVVVGPGYQIGFAARVREEVGVPTVAVGMITEPRQAEQVLADGAADAVALGRTLLVDPYWPRGAARALGEPAGLPPQYLRAEPLLDAARP